MTNDKTTDLSRMSFPFSPVQIFNSTAELFGVEHPRRPSLQVEGDFEELRGQGAAYRAGWIEDIWPEFRLWWTTAPEDERRQRAEEALKRAGLALAGFQWIPDTVWEQTRELRPVAGDTPFCNTAGPERLTPELT